MLYSIIINNYNYGRYLKKAIDSALGQTYPEFEVIVVDDGSTDNSVDVIQSYGDRIVPVFKPNGGQGSAMNAGFAKSRGDLILFLDADDWLEPTALERVFASYSEGVSHLYYQLAMKNPAGEALGTFQLELNELDAGADAWVAVIERGAVNFPPTSANVFSRKALKAVFPIPEEMFRIRADVYLLHTAVFQGGAVAVVEPLANYLVHGSNLWFRDGANKRVGKRRLGLNRYSSKQFQKGLLQTKQKYDLLERGRLAKQADWGPQAKQRWVLLCWRRLLSLKCLGKTHPFHEDTMRGLSAELIELSGDNVPFGLRVRLCLVRFFPSALIRLFLFSNI